MMSSNAQREMYADEVEEPKPLATGMERGVTLRSIAAERLAAHRSRRAVLEPDPASALRPSRPGTSPVVSESARRAREAVEARYRSTPSYREAMAAEPPSVARVAAAKAVAAWLPVAEAVPTQPWAEVSMPMPVAPPQVVAAVEEDFAWLNETPAAEQSIAVPDALPMPEGALQVRPYEDLPQLTTPPPPLRSHHAVPADEIEGLDEEIAFRLAPEFADHLIEPLPIQANIIEFPRQLVAARKARPRLAEGPLRSDDGVEGREAAALESALPATAPAEFQMRIFEVDSTGDAPVATPAATQTAAQAAAAEPAAPVAPQWQHMVLDAAEEEDDAPSWVPAPTPEMPVLPAHDANGALPVASIELRLMSLLVDAVCVGAGFVAFAAFAGWLGGQELRAVPLPTLGLLAVTVVAVLAVVYQALFFTLSRGTLGMSYANLVFKTLAGREPSRRMLRRRVGANVLAVLPAGLGLLWSVVDRRSLGWNDRISGVFLREY